MNVSRAFRVCFINASLSGVTIDEYESSVSFCRSAKIPLERNWIADTWPLKRWNILSHVNSIDRLLSSVREAKRRRDEQKERERKKKVK